MPSDKVIKTISPASYSLLHKALASRDHTSDTFMISRDDLTGLLDIYKLFVEASPALELYNLLGKFPIGTYALVREGETDWSILSGGFDSANLREKAWGQDIVVLLREFTKSLEV